MLGVVGIWALFVVANSLVELLPARATTVIRPYVFVGPAIVVLSIFLLAPAVGTIIQSFTEVPEGEGPFYNYVQAFTDPALQIALRNNVIWLILAPARSTPHRSRLRRSGRSGQARVSGQVLHLHPALHLGSRGRCHLALHLRVERPEGQPQIGILNAIVTSFGGEPVPWLQEIPTNTLALIVAFVWIQTGFAMVILSAAIKGVPVELMEAARIDGAGEFQTFLRIVLPSIRGSVITVFTVTAIAVLKVFDIVYVTTNGNFETDVIANRMFNEMFRFRNFGFATALAVILLVAVIPIMVVNVRNLRRQGIGA